ncbi:putative MFS multidrug transporter [Thozetella sp. PMI_491]|nr:putative MFS multidrug transporter [Thozetella sp. PMI_491]
MGAESGYSSASLEISETIILALRSRPGELDELNTPSDSEQDLVTDLYVDFTTPLPVPVLKDPRNSNDIAPGFESAQAAIIKFGSPLAWSSSRRQAVVLTCCISAVFASFASSSYAPAKAQLVAEWGVSPVAALVGITTFTTGFALAPMVLAPMSEVWGRKPLFISTGLILVLCQIWCALTRSYAGMLVARFFAGVGSSTYSSMVGGVISDIYGPTERNTPMSLFSGAALFGIGLGPLVSGFIAEYSTWRWIFWLQVIANLIIVLLFVVFVQETRESVLLQQKAKYLAKLYKEWEQDGRFEFRIYPAQGSDTPRIARGIRWKVPEDEVSGPLLRMISISALRPFQLLFGEPVVFFFSVWAAFSWSILYLGLAAIPLVYMDIYGFSLANTNATFTSSCVGAVLSTVISVYQDVWLDRRGIIHHKLKLPLDSPERRLYFSCLEAILLPVGLFLFGWTAQPTMHWVLPSIAVGISTMGIFSVYLAVFNYLADTYRSYASSALAAQSFCRNIVGGFFPLITTRMYGKLGLGPGSSLLGACGLALTAGPWILVAFGPSIRARSKFATKLQ